MSFTSAPTLVFPEAQEAFDDEAWRQELEAEAEEQRLQAEREAQQAELERLQEQEIDAVFTAAETQIRDTLGDEIQAVDQDTYTITLTADGRWITEFSNGLRTETRQQPDGSWEFKTSLGDTGETTSPLDLITSLREKPTIEVDIEKGTGWVQQITDSRTVGGERVICVESRNFKLAERATVEDEVLSPEVSTANEPSLATSADLVAEGLQPLASESVVFSLDTTSNTAGIFTTHSHENLSPLFPAEVKLAPRQVIIKNQPRPFTQVVEQVAQAPLGTELVVTGAEKIDPVTREVKIQDAFVIRKSESDATLTIEFWQAPLAVDPITEMSEVLVTPEAIDSSWQITPAPILEPVASPIEVRLEDIQIEGNVGNEWQALVPTPLASPSEVLAGLVSDPENMAPKIENNPTLTPDQQSYDVNVPETAPLDPIISSPDTPPLPASPLPSDRQPVVPITEIVIDDLAVPPEEMRQVRPPERIESVPFTPPAVSQEASFDQPLGYQAEPVVSPTAETQPVEQVTEQSVEESQSDITSAASLERSIDKLPVEEVVSPQPRTEVEQSLTPSSSRKQSLNLTELRPVPRGQQVFDDQDDSEQATTPLPLKSSATMAAQTVTV